jgi:hypothetical protein
MACATQQQRFATKAELKTLTGSARDAAVDGSTCRTTLRPNQGSFLPLTSIGLWSIGIRILGWNNSGIDRFTYRRAQASTRASRGAASRFRGSRVLSVTNPGAIGSLGRSWAVYNGAVSGLPDHATILKIHVVQLVEAHIAA